ncbi:FGGY-family carbohydrate kinase [Novispirillum itersonii]|uniref:FGGY-family pentulose kinase n=1 Tax=Novispirillum itersonii TaxID=189 RepID=A0A7W9ZKC9_NOVIT|nr:FGGY-family carbohydrate kinase [Novispirillum itersonii]MBB6211844.1 FGGY-family pentulose kinase [Novispirillum itersonii]
MTRAVIGVDVGTGSARAGVFDLAGRRLGMAVHPIRMWKPDADRAEQSSDDIWQAVCRAVRQAVAACTEPPQVIGLGFDATCSMAVVDAAGQPVTVSPEGDDARNVIVWMDHRALEQTERINAGGHAVLRYVGGRISPEMQTPKLLWLKEHLPETWARAAHFFDLPDYLTWRATGSDQRSLCSLACKWTYLGHEGRWDDGYLSAVGLGDLVTEGHRRLGTRVGPVGQPVDGGLSAQAAADLGLTAGIAVGTSLIDAHAGGVGIIGAGVDAADPAAFDRRIALIGGTSTCHMAVSPQARFIPGVWGPYYSAMLPGLWLNEGGQSATGALVDHVVKGHARHAELAEQASQHGTTVYALLNARLEGMAAVAGCPVALLAADIHVQPDFHGNRSPRADASLRGMVSGLRLSDSVEELALLYLATVQAIALGTRHIIAEMNRAGYAVDTVLACGGGTKNPLFMQAHADATGCTVVLPQEPEAVLLGSAMLGAVAAGAYADVTAAMETMSHVGHSIPADPAVRDFYDRKYRVFQRMYDDQMAYRALMAAE